MPWRPLPEDPGPRPVSGSLDRVAGGLGVPRAATLSTVFTGWPSLVGESVAARTRPRSLRAGKLVVVADDPGMADSLRWLEADLLARLATALGEGQVTALEVRVAGPEGLGVRPPEGERL